MAGLLQRAGRFVLSLLRRLLGAPPIRVGGAAADALAPAPSTEQAELTPPTAPPSLIPAAHVPHCNDELADRADADNDGDASAADQVPSPGTENHAPTASLPTSAPMESLAEPPDQARPGRAPAPVEMGVSEEPREEGRTPPSAAAGFGETMEDHAGTLEPDSRHKAPRGATGHTSDAVDDGVSSSLTDKPGLGPSLAAALPGPDGGNSELAPDDQVEPVMSADASGSGPAAGLMETTGVAEIADPAPPGEFSGAPAPAPAPASGRSDPDAADPESDVFDNDSVRGTALTDPPTCEQKTVSVAEEVLPEPEPSVGCPVAEDRDDDIGSPLSFDAAIEGGVAGDSDDPADGNSGRNDRGDHDGGHGTHTGLEHEQAHDADASSSDDDCEQGQVSQPEPLPGECADDERDEDGETEPPAAGRRALKAPVYRPRLQRSRVRKVAGPRVAAASPRQFQDLEADLQLFFGAGDWGIGLSALLSLPAGVEEAVVMDGGEEVWLGAMDDRLLEPLSLADVAAVLDQGLSLEAIGLPVRWRRSSRDLHVFGQHASVSGFVSRPRVVIGQENVVICRNTLVGEALPQILATGSAQPSEVQGPGVPDGWTCWRGIRPLRPSAPVPGRSILDALDPLPAVTIELGGGLQLVRGRWLLGHPPAIRLLGLLEAGEPVLIDGHSATAGADGGWTAAGWDAAGRHVVEHGGLSAAYEIDPGALTWEWWPAHRAEATIAGALSSPGGGEYFHSAPSAVLLGARPGEICGFVPAAAGIHVARPSFAPVWMVTGGAGVRRTGAKLVGEALAPAAPAGAGASAGLRWARLVCSAARAGKAGTAERLLWDRYVAAARMRRRRKR